MPTYEYACKKCEQTFEVQQSFTDDPLTKHEKCGGQLRKVFGNIGITFKGSGFYKNDSRSTSSTTKASTESSSSEKSEKSEKSASDSKSSSSDSKSDSKSSSDSSTSKSSDNSKKDGSKDKKSAPVKTK